MIRRRLSLTAVVLPVLVAACGDRSAPPAHPDLRPSGVSVASGPSPAPSVAPDSRLPREDGRTAPGSPSFADDLARALPQAEVFVEAPDLRALMAGGGWGAVLGPRLVELVRESSELRGVDPLVLARALDEVVSVAGSRGLRGDVAGLVVRVAEVAPVDRLLAALPIESRRGTSAGFESLRLRRGSGAPEVELLWAPSERTLVVGTGAFVDALVEVVSRRAPSLADDPNFRATRARAANPRGVTAIVDASKVLPDHLPGGLTAAHPALVTLAPSPANTLTVELPVDGGLAGLRFSEPTRLGLAERLPEEAAGFLAFSTRGAGDPTRRYAALKEALGVFPRGLADAERMLSHLGLAGSSLVEVLGAEGVVAMLVDPKPKDEDPVERRVGFVLLQELASPTSWSRIEAALDKLARDLGHHHVRRDADGFRAVPNYPTDDPAIVVARLGGHAFVGVGNERAIARGLEAARSGAATLGAAAFPKGTPTGISSLVVRLGRALPLLTSKERADLGEPLEAALASAAPLTVSYTPVGGEAAAWSAIRLEVSGHAAIGALAGLATHSVRAYQRSAKTSEARNIVAAIQRAATAAYLRGGDEDEDDGPSARARVPHAGCGSAISVPSEVPRGDRYTPSDAEGRDFNSGDAARGWKCLKFSMSSPIRYRYSFHAGSGYLGPRRGGPDPGPNGFEAAAEGDLDGDGKTSLFTLTGRFDPKTGDVVQGTTFVVDELE